MKNTDIDKIKDLWQLYDKASSKETDYYLKYLYALNQGSKALAKYIDQQILPKLQKKAYRLILTYKQKFETIYEKRR